MDQEYLTPAEQNQLKQGVLSETLQGEDQEIDAGEQVKSVEEKFQGQQNLHQQQRLVQESAQQQNVQGGAQGDAPPDPQKDFMGYIQWLGKTLHKQEALLGEQTLAMNPEAEQLSAFYQQSVMNVKQRHDDFDQAADFIYDTRAKQLAAFSSLYPEMADPNVVDALIGNELKQILRDCAKKIKIPPKCFMLLRKKLAIPIAQRMLVKICRKDKILHAPLQPIMV